MASISSLTGSTSSTSSIYGTRNVISGLASGLDTETLIENCIAGYQTKIQTLQQKQTQLTWKQDAYRSITDKLVALSTKYTSYTSKTNLASNSFFSSNVVTSASGTYADKVSATGKSSSEIQLKSVETVASAARYSVSADALGLNVGGTTGKSAVDFGSNSNVDVSKVSGSLTITYGTRTFDLSFAEDEVYDSAEDFAKAIEDKLNEQSMTLSSGQTVKAGEKVGVDFDESTGEISFYDKGGAGNSVYISSVSGDIEETLGVSTGRTDGKSIKVGNNALSEKKTMAEYLSGKTVSVELNGVSKTITIGDLTEEDDPQGALIKSIQDGIDSAFGEGKINVTTDGNGALSFSLTSANDGDTISVTSDVSEKLGLGKGGVSSYFNTGLSLGDLLGANYFDDAENGEKEIVINGETVGSFTADSTLQDVMDAINNSESGVTVSFSKLTNKFVFNAGTTGSDSAISFDSDLGMKLFTVGGDGNLDDVTDADGNTVSSYKAGTDAVFTAVVNGEELTMTRSENTVDLDGLKVTLKGTFEAESDSDYVSFTTKANSDTIVSAIKSFVEEYNTVVKEIHDAYSTTPLTDSSYNRYMPLTDEDKEDMSESAIATYEEKAKTGLLFGDSDLSSLYSRLVSAMSPTGTSRADFRDIGLSTSYSNGVTTLELDEDKLLEALDSDPDKVRRVFAQSTENGASSDGLMASLKKVTDAYASTSIATPGILVKKAGSTLSSYSLNSNTLQSQISDYDEQIEKWKTKMSDKIDYYTTQFTKLEQLMNEMNSQSSALSSLISG